MPGTIIDVGGRAVRGWKIMFLGVFFLFWGNGNMNIYISNKRYKIRVFDFIKFYLKALLFNKYG